MGDFRITRTLENLHTLPGTTALGGSIGRALLSDREQGKQSNAVLSLCLHSNCGILVVWLLVVVI